MREGKVQEALLEDFQPQLICFLCNWCSYAGADKAGSAQKAYPGSVRVLKVMCSGRVEPRFILEAFSRGADGVLVLACHLGDCHYKKGNYHALRRMRLLTRLLREFGIEEERCVFDHVSAGEGERFVQVVNGVIENLRRLGPLRSRLPDQSGAAGLACWKEEGCEPESRGDEDGR